MKIRSICFVVVSFWSLNAHAATLDLATAGLFAVLAGSTVTNTGPTTIQGNVGVWPGTAITGFPPGIVSSGTIHAGDAVAQQAQSDLTTAYNVAAGEAFTLDLSGQDLGGKTLTPGVYNFTSSAQLTGKLTLDNTSIANALFVFQIGSTLTTASNSSVVFKNGGDNNVFWQVGSSATIDTNTAFEGNILALTSIALLTGASIEDGRALARNGAVTLDTNEVKIPSAIPEPSTWAMLLLGFASIAFMAYRRKSKPTLMAA
jgi:hypothetical protein